ncbi:MAG: DUF1254 domain-containing protein [Bacteroidales bacterium]|nr:DUF1254 domain-containing protein [Bacteroidales bacterium]
MKTAKFKITSTTLVFLLFFYSCKQEVKVTPEEVKQIAKEAYIYGFPLVMNCKTVYDYVVNENSPEYKAPFNQKSCEARVYTPDDKTIVTPNSDTPYCMIWMNLRAEPQVISVPEMESARYYSFQMIDWYTHNFAYIGTRTNNNEAGKYLLVGPDWDGDKPEGITEIINSETNLVFIIVRTQAYDANDMDKIKEIQESYELQSLSAYLGKEAPASSPEIDFPEWVNGSEFTIASFEYLDFALDQVDTHPDEVEFMEKLAKIGLGTPEIFNLSEKDSSFIKALEDGVKEAHAEMKDFTKEAVKDPLGSVKGFGTREFLKEAASYFNQPNFYMQRAVVAQLGLYGNSGEEAVYFGYYYDKEGEPWNAAEHNYTFQFEEGNLPPVNAFWSLSMYDGPTQLFIHNPLDRYLLNSNMINEFKKEEDGSIVLYIQKETPGKDMEANWLPAPDGPFYLMLRMYLPKEEVLEGKWAMPTLEKVQ